MTVAHRDLPLPNPAALLWLDGLRTAVRSERTRRPPEVGLARFNPPPTARELDCEQELIAEHLRCWLQNGWQLVTNSPQFGGGLPVIVITTSIAGLRVEKQLQSETGPTFGRFWQTSCFVTEFEYRLWCRQRPDAGFQLHINHWAWAKTRVPAARNPEFAAFPIPDGDRYWLFRHGLAGCGHSDHHSCRLYRSDGQSLELLEANFREGVAGL